MYQMEDCHAKRNQMKDTYSRATLEKPVEARSHVGLSMVFIIECLKKGTKCDLNVFWVESVDGMITFSGNSALFANIAYLVEPD